MSLAIIKARQNELYYLLQLLNIAHIILSCLETFPDKTRTIIKCRSTRQLMDKYTLLAYDATSLSNYKYTFIAYGTTSFM